MPENSHSNGSKNREGVKSIETVKYEIVQTYQRTGLIMALLRVGRRNFAGCKPTSCSNAVPSWQFNVLRLLWW